MSGALVSREALLLRKEGRVSSLLGAWVELFTAKQQAGYQAPAITGEAGIGVLEPPPDGIRSL